MTNQREKDILNLHQTIEGHTTRFVSVNRDNTNDTSSNYLNDGATEIGSIAIGHNAHANGKQAVTLGYNSFAKGQGSVVIGESSDNDTGGEAAKKGQFDQSIILGAKNRIAAQPTESGGREDKIIGNMNIVDESHGTFVRGTGNSVYDAYNDEALTDEDKQKERDFLDRLHGGDPTGLFQKGRSHVTVDGDGNLVQGALYTRVSGVGNEVSNTSLDDETSTPRVTYNIVTGNRNTVADSSHNLIIGDNHELEKVNGNIIIGSLKTKAKTEASDVTILGNDANVSVDGGVALGTGSVASTAAGVFGYDPATDKASTTDNATWKSVKDAVSVGTADATRQITNLAAGTADTDAVNVAQLKNSKTAVEAGDYVTVTKKTEDGKGTTYTVKGPKLTAEDNLTVTDDVDNNKKIGYKVKLNKDLTGLTSVTSDAFKVGDKTYINSQGINANNNKITNVADGAADGDAVNFKQLKDVKTIATTNQTNIGKLQAGFTVKDGGTGKADVTLGGDTKQEVTFKAAVDKTTEATADGSSLTSTVDTDRNVTYSLNMKQLKQDLGITDGPGGVMSSWKLKVKDETTPQEIKNGEAVTFDVAAADKGLTVTRDEKTIKYGIEGSKIDIANNQSITNLGKRIDNLPSIHYFSIKSDDSANPAGTNWKNDGASGENAIAIGKDAKAEKKASVVIGLKASSGDAANDGVAVGSSASVTGFSGVAIGRGSSAEGQETVAIGDGAKGVIHRTVAIGGKANAGGFGAVAIGRDSSSNVRGVSVGIESNSKEFAVSVGTNSFSNFRSVAVGEMAKAESKYSVAVGDQTASYAEAGVTLGNKTRVYGDSSVAIGNQARVSGKPLTEAEYNALPDAEKSSYKVQIARYPNPADPKNPTIEKTYFKVFNAADWNAQKHYNSIAIGTTSFVEAKEAIGIGAATWIHGDRGVALGYTATSGEKGTALGAGAQAKANAGVALGEGAVADTAAEVAGYDPKTGKASTETTPTWKSVKGAVSVGNADATRQITNLAAGSADTDAVNVAQLKAAQTHYFSVNADDSAAPADTNWNNDGAKSTGSIAVGQKARTLELPSDALQTPEKISSDHAVALGSDASAAGKGSVAIGKNAVTGTRYATTPFGMVLTKNIAGAGAVAVGDSSQAATEGSVAVGRNATAGYYEERLPEKKAYGIAIGDGAKAVGAAGQNTAGADKDDAGLAVGMQAYAAGNGTITMGYKAHAENTQNIIIGSNATTEALLLPSGSKTVHPISSIGIGADAVVKGRFSVAIGTGASVGNGQMNLSTGYGFLDFGGVALGYKSQVDRPGSVGLGSWTRPWRQGDQAAEQTKYAHGTKVIAPFSGQKLYFKDDIGGAQVYNTMGDNSVVNGVVSVGGVYEERNRKIPFLRQIINVGDGTEDTDAVNLRQLKAVDKKLDTTSTTAGTALQSWDAQIGGTKVKTVDKDHNTLNFVVGNNISLTNDSGKIKIATLDNVEFNKVTVGGVVIDKDADINAGGKKITNLAAGTEDTDAVNVSQLNGVKTNVTNNTNNITALKGGFTVSNADDSVKPTITLGGDPKQNIKFAGETGKIDVTVEADGTAGAKVTVKANAKLGENIDLSNNSTITAINNNITTLQGGFNVTSGSGTGAIKAGDTLAFAGKNYVDTQYDAAAKKLTIGLDDATKTKIDNINTTIDAAAKWTIKDSESTPGSKTIDAATPLVVQGADGVTAKVDATKGLQLGLDKDVLSNTINNGPVITNVEAKFKVGADSGTAEPVTADKDGTQTIKFTGDGNIIKSEVSTDGVKYTVDETKLKDTLSNTFAKTDASNLTGDNVTQWRKKLGVTDDALSQASAWKLRVNGEEDKQRTIGKDDVVNFVDGTYTKVTATGNDVTIDLNKAAKDKLAKVDTLEGQIKANKVQVTGDAATGVKVADTQENDGSTTYKVSLDEKIQVGGVAVNGKDGKGEVTGLTNTSLNVAGFATSKRAATEEQLQLAMDQMSANAKITTVESGDENIVVKETKGQNENKYTVALNKDLNVDSLNAGGTTVNKDGITLQGKDGKPGVTITKDGIDAGNKKITKVADGVDAHDAATVGQLKDLAGAAGNGLNELGNQIGRLDGRVNKVGAGAAALAALHPVDFDADDKLDVAAGWGHYKGRNAMALGAFYRPDERTMFSLGGTVGNGENMINAGITFKLDKRRGPIHAITSKVQLVQEVTQLKADNDELRKDNAELREQMKEINAKLEKLMAAK